MIKARLFPAAKEQVASGNDGGGGKAAGECLCALLLACWPFCGDPRREFKTVCDVYLPFWMCSLSHEASSLLVPLRRLLLLSMLVFSLWLVPPALLLL